MKSFEFPSLIISTWGYIMTANSLIRLLMELSKTHVMIRHIQKFASWFKNFLHQQNFHSNLIKIEKLKKKNSKLIWDANTSYNSQWVRLSGLNLTKTLHAVNNSLILRSIVKSWAYECYILYIQLLKKVHDIIVRDMSTV